MSDAPSDPVSLNDLLPTTPDGREERLAELKRLFPDLFTNEGRLNPDELKQLIAPNEVHETERYEFKWYGKAASKREAFTPTTATLVYDEARSVNPEKADGNMIIEGENLETLKLLLNAYREQVKCIYIDPPYNTGKDFIYRDNYKLERSRYWEESGLSEDGVPLESNPETSGRYHSDWLSMMQTRLLVARQLLSESGFLVVSCDDNEVENLHRLLNEIYGEDGFVAKLIWKCRAFPDARAVTGVSTDHEYLFVFRKSEKASFKGVPRDESKFSNPDNDSRGPWMSRSMLGLASKEQRPNLHFSITDEKTGFTYDPPSTTGWRYSPERMNKMISEERVLFPGKKDGRPREKKFRADIKGDFVPFPTIVDGVHTSHGTSEIRQIFGETVFDFSKPSDLIAQIVHQVTAPGDLVVDFFGGSGTTGQAIFADTKEERRKFVIVQIPEVVEPNSAAGREGFTTIASITIERVKRVIEGYGDNPQPIPDAGFKVFKLQKSNFPRCEFKPDPAQDEAANVEALRRYIDEKEASFFLTLNAEGEQAVFDEVLLKNGFQLHYTRTRSEDFPDNTIYEVRDPRRTAFVCLAWNESIKDATIKKLRDLAESGDKPFFICLERSLSTTAKWNLKHFLGNHFNAF